MSEFQKVIRFLDDSRAAVDAERERAKKAAEREREQERLSARRTRVVAAVMSAIALIAVAGFGFAIAANQAMKVARSRMNDALYAQGVQRHVAVVQATIAKRQRAMAEAQKIIANRATNVAKKETAFALAQERIARQQTAIALLQRRRALSAQAQAESVRSSLQLAVLNGGLLNANSYDLRAGGLIAVDSYALSPTNGAAAGQLLWLVQTSDALERVALPPWNLGAIAGNGHDHYIAVLAGARQSRHAEPVTGSLVKIDPATLDILARTAPVVRATFMCGFNSAPRVAVATGAGIDEYDLTSSSAPVRIASRATGPVRAMACSQASEQIVYVDAYDVLRSADFSAGNPSAIAHLGGNVDGVVLSPSGRLAAVTTTSGSVQVYNLPTGHLLESTQLTRPREDCSIVSGCASDVSFVGRTDATLNFAWYDAGVVHVETVVSAKQKSYPCNASFCARPTLMNFGATIPEVLADGILAYDATATPPAYKKLYSDRTGTSYPLLDSEFNMAVSAYDPQNAFRPNPFGGGLATHSFAEIKGPMLGRVSASQWGQSFGLYGHHMLIPSQNGFVAYNLDRLREGLSKKAPVSYTMRMRDSGDGIHAVTFEFKTGCVEIHDIRQLSPPSDRCIGSNRFRTDKVSVYKSGGSNYYSYDVELAYDPKSDVISLLKIKNGSTMPWPRTAELVRFSSHGRVLERISREKLAVRAGITLNSITNWMLSERGSYIVLKRPPGMPDMLVRPDGSLVGKALSIQGVSSNEKFAYAHTDAKEKLLTLYRLPEWQSAGITPIPQNAYQVTVAPDGHTLAYDDNGNLRLYNLTSREPFGAPNGQLSLPTPPELGVDRGLAFSADSRYLLVTYEASDTDKTKWVAVYAADPTIWARSLCLMAGSKLTPKEFLAIAGSAIRYRNGCAPYKSKMYH